MLASTSDLLWPLSDSWSPFDMAFPPSAFEYFSAFAFAPPASQYAFW